MGAHGAVVAGDDDAAAAGGVGGGDEVFGADAGFGVLGPEGRGVFVGADAADVEGGVGGEDVLWWFNVGGLVLMLLLTVCVVWGVMGDGEGKGGEWGGVKYLCATGGVLCSTARYEFCVVVLEQVFVQTHVLFFGEDGVVGLETVFGKHCFIARAGLSEL